MRSERKVVADRKLSHVLSPDPQPIWAAPGVRAEPLPATLTPRSQALIVTQGLVLRIHSIDHLMGLIASEAFHAFPKDVPEEE